MNGSYAPNASMGIWPVLKPISSGKHYEVGKGAGL